MKKDAVSFRKLSLVLPLSKVHQARGLMFSVVQGTLLHYVVSLMKFLDFFPSAAFQRRKRKEKRPQIFGSYNWKL